jgi:hypothetical protein
MPSERYSDYYISVFHTPDQSGNASCVPFVEIRHKRDRGPEVRLMLNEAFSSEREASTRGFAAGKQWVDERLAKRNPMTSTGIAKKAPVGSQRIRFRLKSWFVSLRLGFS